MRPVAEPFGPRSQNKSLMALPKVAVPAALCLAASVILAVSTRQAWDVSRQADRSAVLDVISPSALAAHVGYLASDELQGRATPSPGLELAAKYIAGEFKKAGLSPFAGGNYLQQATFKSRDGTEYHASNVIGILEGSDPTLKETYLILSAHYDHLGTNPRIEGDSIYNGANDDASGTAGVIQLAYALSKAKPRRSIVFIAFCGEERGLLGSRYYGRNPIVPLKQTICQVNLEQIGRFDEVGAPEPVKGSMTGFDFSDVGPLFSKAAQTMGTDIQKHPQNSDAFFSRSDNQSLADLGIPAHTICGAYVFPDYHRPSDHADKLDYKTMATLLKGVAVGVLTIADSDRAPQWNPDNPKAAKYLAAWRALHGD